MPSASLNPDSGSTVSNPPATTSAARSHRSDAPLDRRALSARHRYLHLRHQRQTASGSRSISCPRERWDRHLGGDRGRVVFRRAQERVTAQSVGARKVSALEKFLAPLEVADYGRDAAIAYGELRAALAKKGTPIGPLDTQIAAHALALGVTLVSNNVREFRRVPKLRLENWA